MHAMQLTRPQQIVEWMRSASMLHHLFVELFVHFRSAVCVASCLSPARIEAVVLAPSRVRV